MSGFGTRAVAFQNSLWPEFFWWLFGSFRVLFWGRGAAFLFFPAAAGFLFFLPVVVGGAVV
jgi:hypothetical protein